MTRTWDSYIHVLAVYQNFRFAEKNTLKFDVKMLACGWNLFVMSVVVTCTVHRLQARKTFSVCVVSRVSTPCYGNNGEATRCSAMIDWIISPTSSRSPTPSLSLFLTLSVYVCSRSAFESTENMSLLLRHTITLTGGRHHYLTIAQKYLQSVNYNRS